MQCSWCQCCKHRRHCDLVQLPVCIGDFIIVCQKKRNITIRIWVSITIEMVLQYIKSHTGYETITISLPKSTSQWRPLPIWSSSREVIRIFFFCKASHICWVPFFHCCLLCIPFQTIKGVWNCSLILPSVKTLTIWQKSLLCDYWAKLDGFFAEVQIIS